MHQNQQVKKLGFAETPEKSDSGSKYRTALRIWRHCL
jgi:hypothetical protein